MAGCAVVFYTASPFTTSSLAHQPCSYSKTLAEQEGWRLAKLQSPWQLVVVNPSLVVGPGTNPLATCESFNIVRQLGNGTMKFGAPRAGFGVVDVRDLAQAHLAAAFIPGAQGRHIVSGHNTDLLAVGQSLLPRFGDRFALPRRQQQKPSSFGHDLSAHSRKGWPMIMECIALHCTAMPITSGCPCSLIPRPTRSASRC